MNANIEKASSDDVEDMVALSRQKRIAYAEALPLFWRKAPNAEVEQTRFFTALVEDEQVITLVHREDNNVNGLNCMIDDFVVQRPDQWATIGKALLEETFAIAKSMGAVQVVVVSGAHDNVKRQFLDGMNLSIASVWYTSAI